MHELQALARLALIRHRWELKILLIVAGSGLALAALNWLTAADRSDREIAGMMLRLMLLPVGLAGAILFDYSQGVDLLSPASGCSHWILQQPVKSWKIAVVPVFIKTLWISACWLSFAVSLRVMGVPVPLVTPCLFFSGAAIWLMVVAWKPLRRGWHRLVWLAICLITSYGMLWLIMGSAHLEDLRWRTAAFIAAQVISATLYVTAVLAALRVVVVARTATMGLVAEHASQPAAVSQDATAYAEHVDASPLQALAWNEFANIKLFALRTLLIGVLPGILIAGCLLPLNPAMVVLVLLGFGYLAGVSVCGGQDARSGTGSTLPSHLLTSPLTSVQLAWTRAAVWLSVVASVFSCVVFVFLLWSLWPNNRETWMQWATDQAVAIGGGMTPGATGLRLSAAIVLAAAVLAIGRLVAYWWVGMSGRKWFILMMTIVSAAMYLIPLALFLRWFMVQTQWSEVQQRLYSLLSWVPQMAAGLLTLKAVATAVVAAIGLQMRIVSSGIVAKLVGGWMMLVLLLAIVLATLIPYPEASFMACLCGVALALPLARVLVMPLMVDWNRHR